MLGQVADKSLPTAVVQGVCPEVGGLTEVVLSIAAHVAVDISGQRTAGLQGQGPGTLLGSAERVGEIVGGSVLIVSHCHGAIALEVSHIDPVRAVNRDLHAVAAQAVPLGIAVGKESPLEHLIRRGLYSRYHVGRTEGQLFDFREIVGGVTIEDELADGQQREVLLRPHFGDIEGIEATLLGLLVEHYLYQI